MALAVGHAEWQPACIPPLTDAPGVRTASGTYPITQTGMPWLIRFKLYLLSLLERFLRSLSPMGAILGTLFFAMSLTPSLVPRPFVLQGLLSGVALAAGYGLGVLGRWLWVFLELPVVRGRPRWVIKGILGLVCLAIAIAFLVQASAWQNEVRALMAVPPVEGRRPFTVGLVALVTFGLLLGVGRLFALSVRFISAGVNRVVPRRISAAVGLLASLFLFWAVIEGVLARAVLNGFDTSFGQLDAHIEPEFDPPTEAWRTGSAGSLVAWKDVGRQGRRFLSGAPSRADIAAVAGAPARDPLRVYVGLNSAESIEARAELALQELKRIGGFQRAVLVVVAPTGTGWVDPGAMTSLEYLHRGDVASVAVQYSYLPSWLTLLAQPEFGADTARELFQRVYAHWRTLPREARPRLYLHGLSLGALNSERSADIWDIVGEPIHGALWSGPPFRSSTWQWVTRQRLPDSPAWLPRFRDGSVIRFTHQQESLADFDAPWGPLRIVYLQYASDPVTFFDPATLYREPQWLSGRRGPDVSPSLRWFPVVTMLQLLVDIMAADGAPIGYGHAYASEHYIDAWRAVSAPQGWDEAGIARLKAAIGDLD
jgi:uncharacterized membrane protein